MKTEREETVMLPQNIVEYGREDNAIRETLKLFKEGKAFPKPDDTNDSE